MRGLDKIQYMRLTVSMSIEELEHHAARRPADMDQWLVFLLDEIERRRAEGVVYPAGPRSSNDSGDAVEVSHEHGDPDNEKSISEESVDSDSETDNSSEDDATADEEGAADQDVEHEYDEEENADNEPDDEEDWVQKNEEVPTALPVARRHGMVLRTRAKI